MLNKNNKGNKMTNLNNSELNQVLDGLYATRDTLLNLPKNANNWKQHAAQLVENMITIKKVYELLINLEVETK